jgi:radical SAM protein with 4Fe4S-binding SPASM domain
VDRFARLLPTLVKLGCRSISLAGGEPMLHHDLPLILRLSRRANMIITLYTNGTLLDERVLGALRSTLGTKVIVSFYAASDEAYERLSLDRSPNLFTTVKDGVARLKAAGVPYQLQIFTYRGQMSVYEDLKRIFPGEAIARGWIVMPRSAAEHCNQNCMVPAEEVRDQIFLRHEQPEFAERLFEFLYEQKMVFSCAAGLASVHINSYFSIYPCLYVRDPAMTFSLDDHSFEEIFFEKMPRALMNRISASSPCHSCTIRQSCFRCRAFGYGTDWAEQGEHSLCKIARIAEEKRSEASLHD